MRPRAGLAIAAAAGALLACVRMRALDLPLAIAGGERLLATGEVPATNPWNWAHPGFPWLDDKWGFGLVCAGAHRFGGGAALSLLNAALGAAAGALVYAVARRRNSPWYACGVALVGVTMLSHRVLLRAEWISVLGIAWTLLRLDGVVAGSRRRAVLVVAAMPVWAACHVYWPLGPILVVAASAAAKSWRGALVGVAAFAAAAISPYGVANLVHPFKIAAGASQFDGAITELRLPIVGGPFTFFHLLAVLCALQLVVWTVAHWLAKRRADTVVTALLIVFALRYDRNLGLLGVAYAFSTPSAPDGAEQRVAGWQGWTLAPAVLGLVAGIAWLAPDRTIGLGWDERAQPFRLVASLGPETASKRYVNDFSVGSFLDWKRGASFIDGNTHGYPPEHFALYRSALEGSTAVAEIDRRFPNDGWFLRTSAPHTRVLVVGLFLEGDYAPTDSDGVATLFRHVDDVERADDLWRRWLADTYLPTARAWFATGEEALAALGGAPAADDVGGWRRLVVASPWEKTFLDGLRKAYDVRGEPVQAARVWRLARRLG